MKIIFTFGIVILFVFSGRSQGLILEIDSFLNKKEYRVSIIKTINRETNSYCYIINVLRLSNNGSSERQLYLFKIFSNNFIRLKREPSLISQFDSLNAAYAPLAFSRKKNLANPRTNLPSKVVGFYSLKTGIDNVLKENLFLKADLTSPPIKGVTNDYQMLFDNLLVQIKDSIYYFNGSILLQYFNLYDFRQISPLQSSQTIINTKAILSNLKKLSQITGNGADSVFMYPETGAEEYSRYKKIYLTKIEANKTDTAYIFCRLVLQGIDDYLHQTEFFSYIPQFGVTRFKGIYVYKNGPAAVVMRFSSGILEFEPFEYLRF